MTLNFRTYSGYLTSFLRRLSVAARIPIVIKNWPEIYRNIFGGKPVSNIQLRNGFCIHGRASDQLWNHFNSIWFRDTYTTIGRIPRDGVVIDIGANIGFFSLYAVRAGSRVYAFEPFPETFAELLRNIDRSGVSNLVKAYPFAIGRMSGEVRLHIGESSTANSALRESSASVTVQQKTLQDVFEENSIEHCHFLKMDCEGSEFEILLNADRELLKRVEFIALEYHDHLTCHKHPALLEKLREAGFDAKIASQLGACGIIAGGRR